VKLLHITSSLDPKMGGVAQAVKTLVSELKELSVSSEIVTLDSPEADCYPLGPGSGFGQYSSRLLPWLKANISNFDVCIIHGLWSYHTFAAHKAIHYLQKQPGNKKLPRILVMPHGMLDPYFQQAKERRIKAIRNWFYWKFIESRVVNEADGLLFTCETELLLARETFSPYHPKKEYNIGYGIESPPAYLESMDKAFKSSCKGLDGAPYLLFLSRIHSKKGIDLLLKAYLELHNIMRLASEKLPKLVIAGPGLDSKFGKALKGQLAGTPEFENEIFFPGMLSGEAKWGAFYGCEAFILPSHQENFGIAVVEALACSKPVLISNQVNIWREISTEGGGIIENNTINGALNMLIRWIDLTPEKKSQMSVRALNAYQNHFTLNRTAQKIVSMISDLDIN
jgi:glycosyltransferase involved in cell wall biosynthesis